MNDFMVEGGEGSGSGMGGESIYGSGFEDEFCVEGFNLQGGS